ncbi:MAG: PilZ domain-containing protein [Candidatus Aceula meridiana]|nr:PilZ domain-containing protein [Candidatus Aceula meridiana]
MEKRIAARYDCQVPLLDEKKETLGQSQTIDISKSGVGFVSARFIPINTKMMIEISLARDGEPVLIQGKVKWVEKAVKASTYRIGMTFPDISETAQSRIESYFHE